MLSIDLAPLMAARGVRKIHPYLVRAGIPNTAARKLTEGTYRQVPLDHLERLCLLLRCTPNDLLTWTPKEGSATEGQPLSALRKGEERGLEWLAEARNMGVDELRELGRRLKEVRDLPPQAG